MAITLADFNKIWASTSPLTPYSFSEANYKQGWNFIGSTPPARQMWDFLQKNNDEKMQYLANNYLPLSGGTVSGTVTFSTGSALRRNNENGLLVVTGGYSGGATLSLSGKERATATGEFQLTADNGTANKTLVGSPNGTLTWDGKLLSAPSGRILTASGTVARVTSTYVDIASVTANVNISNRWLVIGHTEINVSLAGTMIVQQILNANGSTSRYDGDGGGGCVSASVVTISSNTTFTLRGYSGSTTAFNFAGQIYAIPLM